MNLLNDYPYLQNILFGWAKLIVPVLVVVSLIALKQRSSLEIKTLIKFFIGFFIFFLLVALLKSFVQFSVWASDEKTQYLLPPHDPTYFYQYAFFRFFLGGIISLFGAIIFGGLLWVLYRFSRGAMLALHEVFLGCLMVFVVGWPAQILFVSGVFVGMTLYAVGLHVVKLLKPAMNLPEQVSLTPFFFIIAVPLVLTPDTFIRMFGLAVFRIPS